MMPRDSKDITNRVLLEHMQAIKENLSMKFSNMGKGLGSRIDTLEKRMDKMETTMERGFREAKEHRETLQEDLEATILQLNHVQKDHGHHIVRLEKHTGLVPAA